MKISIITPSYNQADFIEKTIKSVLSQNYSNFEYIVIDGGSTDNTVNILKKYSNKITWISEKDNGQSDAINKGLKMATGDIVAYLNSDDTYTPGTFKKIVTFFENNPNKKWVYGKCKIINKQDKEIRKLITWYKNLLLKNYSYKKLLAENFISQPATFWKRELLNEIGYFDENENFCMDYEYWLRIGQKYPAGVINSYLANFRYYSDSKSGSVNNQQFQDELRLAQKYGSKKCPLCTNIHRFNYYKITFIYTSLQLTNNILAILTNIIKLTIKKIIFISKVALGKEVIYRVQKHTPTKFIGSKKYGGWFICPSNIRNKNNCIIYSFGVGEDINFDLSMINKYKCQVYAFDPTPKSIKWIKNQNLPTNLHFYKFGISDKNGTIRLYPPQNPQHVSHSIFPRATNRKNKGILVPMYTLKTIMQKLNHHKIDILKMDIEGSEYNVIKNILKEKIQIEQILVEFHHRFHNISTKQTKDTIKALNEHGYKIFAISPSKEEYSFIKNSKNN